MRIVANGALVARLGVLDLWAAFARRKGAYVLVRYPCFYVLCLTEGAFRRPDQQWVEFRML